MLTRIFKLDSLHTTVKTECFAGLTTFLTMAYILLVNPAILSEAGMDKGAVFTATILTISLGTFFCGIFSNLPIAIAPALGLNTFFTFIVVQKIGFSWEETLGAVLIAGVIFIILTFLRIRQWVINAIPHTLHMAIASGIGLFLAVVGLKEMHVIEIRHGLSLGNIFSAQAGLGFCGFILMVVFDKLKIRGPILLSIFIITVLSMMLGFSHLKEIINFPPSLKSSLFAFNMHALSRPNGIAVIFTFVLVALFDSTGTLIGLLHQAKLTNNKAISKALIAEGATTITGSLLGTSTTSPYIESAAGIASGGRSGLTACVISLLFASMLFFAPIAQAVPIYACAPALLYVACKMLANIVYINWRDPVESVPGIFTMIMIPLTFSIANGVALGFVIYIALKVLTGQWRSIQWSSSVLFVLFILFLIFSKSS